MQVDTNQPYYRINLDPTSITTKKDLKKYNKEVAKFLFKSKYALQPAISVLFCIKPKKELTPKEAKDLIGKPHREEPLLTDLVIALQNALVEAEKEPRLRGMIHSITASKVYAPEASINLFNFEYKPSAYRDIKDTIKKVIDRGEE